MDVGSRHSVTRESPKLEPGPLHVDQLPIVMYNSSRSGIRLLVNAVIVPQSISKLILVLLTNRDNHSAAILEELNAQCAPRPSLRLKSYSLPYDSSQHTSRETLVYSCNGCLGLKKKCPGSSLSGIYSAFRDLWIDWFFYSQGTSPSILDPDVLRHRISCSAGSPEI